jgi:tetratricopeptide (TPR) repeat protein
MRSFRAVPIIFASAMLTAFTPAVPGEQPERPPAPTEAVIPQVAALVDEAAEFIERRQWEEAIQLLTLALEIEPGNGLAHARRAYCYGWTNRLAEAEKDLAAAEEAAPGTALNHRVRALIAGRRSDEATELAEFTRSLELEPGHPWALESRAWILHKKGREAEAIADADALIRARPDDPDAHALKAQLLTAQQKHALAAEEAKLLAKLFPGNAHALSSAARIHSALGDRDQALKAIGSAIDRSPEFYRYYQLRAQFRRWDDYLERRRDLHAALERQPNDLGIITELGLLDFQQRRWADAIAKFSLLLMREPKDFGVMAYRAMARDMLGDEANADRDYSAAMAAASGADDFNLVCDCLAHEGISLDRAMAACNRAIELDPKEPRYRANRGIALLRLEENDAALADFDFAVRADGRLARPLYGRALVQWRKGDRENALADLRQARAIDPTIDDAFRKHGFRDMPEADPVTALQAAK